MYKTKDKNFDKLRDREQLKEEKRKGEIKNAQFRHLTRDNFGVIRRLMNHASKSFSFPLCPFFPVYPSSSALLPPPLYAIPAILIGSLCGLKGTRYSVAEFTPPFYPQFRASPFSFDPLAFPSPRPFFPFFPQLFMHGKGQERSPFLFSPLDSYALFVHARGATHLVHNKHTRG